MKENQIIWGVNSLEYAGKTGFSNSVFAFFEKKIVNRLATAAPEEEASVVALNEIIISGLDAESGVQLSHFEKMDLEMYISEGLSSEELKSLKFDFNK